MRQPWKKGGMRRFLSADHTATSRLKAGRRWQAASLTSQTAKMAENPVKLTMNNLLTSHGAHKHASAGVLPCVSVIIPACNEALTLRENLQQLNRWPLVKEVIVVANGCTDDTVSVAFAGNARVIEFDQPLGHDTGRAIGAKYATGRYLLFIDADIVWQRQDLVPYIEALKKGADVALNSYPTKRNPRFHHPTAIAKRALNTVLRQDHLGASSMTGVPHAIRASSLSVIGWETLAIPPLAQAKAALCGLTLVAPHHVQVGTRNRWSRRYKYTTKDVIIGDHLQALAYVIRQKGPRAGFTDYRRKRDYLDYPQAHPTMPADPDSVTAIVPACNESATLRSVIRALQLASIERICVVDNGSGDDTRDIAEALGALVEHFPESIGHDIGRAIGVSAMGASGATVFVDGDFPVPAQYLETFRDAVVSSDIDVALNDLDSGLARSRKTDTVSTMKAFLNIALGRPDLGVNSLTAVPHAMGKRALKAIPWRDLCVPPKAHASALLHGLNVQPVCFVDVVKANKYRPAAHSGRAGAPLAQMITGDHVEALALLIECKGERGGYVQPRALHVLKMTTTTG